MVYYPDRIFCANRFLLLVFFVFCWWFRATDNAELLTMSHAAFQCMLNIPCPIVSYKQKRGYNTVFDSVVDTRVSDSVTEHYLSPYSHPI